jgi:hypothetical protein
MNQIPSMSQMAVPTQGKRSGCGCLGLGCLVSAVISILVAVGVSWFVLRSVRGAVEGYTSEQATAVPVATIDDATRQSAEQKLADLREVLGSKEGQGGFSFSGPELQAIAQNAVFGNKVALDAQGDALHATFSFPLSAFNNPAFDLLLSKALTNRFFNGSAVAKLGVADGGLSVTFQQLTLNGKSLGGDALTQAGWFVSGALESFVLGLAGESKTSGNTAQGASGRIRNAGVSDGVLRLEIGPLLQPSPATQDK